MVHVSTSVARANQLHHLCSVGGFANCDHWLLCSCGSVHHAFPLLILLFLVRLLNLSCLCFETCFSTPLPSLACWDGSYMAYIAHHAHTVLLSPQFLSSAHMPCQCYLLLANVICAAVTTVSCSSETEFLFEYSQSSCLVTCWIETVAISVSLVKISVFSSSSFCAAFLVTSDCPYAASYWNIVSCGCVSFISCTFFSSLISRFHCCCHYTNNFLPWTVNNCGQSRLLEWAATCNINSYTLHTSCSHEAHYHS